MTYSDFPTLQVWPVLLVLAVAVGIGVWGSVGLWRRRHGRHDDCPFCRIDTGKAPATVVRRWRDAIAIVPIGPVVDDHHLLVIPRRHVRDMTTNPRVTGLVARRAAQLAVELGWEHGHFVFNLGALGGQSVWHIHGHVLRSSESVRHTMPWTDQKERGA